MTASLLSQIENGKSDPSVSTLSALVAELGLSLDALLRPDQVDGALDAFDDLNDLNDLSRPERSSRESPVIRPLERPSLDLDSGVCGSA